ncbi:MAG: FtsW/RodA/SpoVE family cell cycle protein [Candidatus Marinimicrobia bacterium]|nr:FtsW/RodA/SpoVE family cell cycle protein [Candidatus Neomarinimicrobiota bacterium]
MNQQTHQIEYNTFKISLTILIAFGMIMLYSASSRISFYKFDDSSAIFFDHLKRMFAAFIIALAAYRVDYRLIRKLNIFFFFSAIIIVAFPLLAAAIKNDPKPARWIHFGSFTFQTAEIARFSLIIFISNYVAKQQTMIRDLKEGFIPVVSWLLLFIVLIAIAPDFSTAMILYLIFMSVIYMGGGQLKHILSLTGIIGFIGFIYVRFEPYRWKRILSFMDHDTNKEASYQVTQSLISLGNGHFFGRSLGGSYGKNMFLPEAHTDFIFSIIGEEWGFLGTSLIILIFLVFFYSLYRISNRVKDVFARLVIFSTAFSILLYALVNAAVCVELFPVTGLPMPFVSYSGSQIIINAALLGMVFNIIKQEKI